MPRKPHHTPAARRVAASLSVAIACAIALANFFASPHEAAKQPASEVEPRAVTTAAGQSATARAEEAYGALPLQFEANRGQTDASVKFLARGSGYQLFLTPGEAVLALHKPTAADEGDAARASKERPVAAVERAVLRMKLLGSNPSPVVEGQQPLVARSNYFVGGASGSPVSAETYARVRYAGVYDGVDAVYYGNQRQLEYDFVVHPHADPGQIAFGFEGAETVEVDGEGELVLRTALGEVRQQKPFVYQEDEGGARREVAGRYVVRAGREVAFELGDYDASKTLVIDPVLVYSTYHGGGSSLDTAHGVAVDAGGNAYITGETISLDFPTSADALQKTYGGSNYDAYVTKLNATGTAIVYSTYLGGDGQDQAYDIAVDADGNAYVTGRTASENFPVAPGAFQPAAGGGFFPNGLGGDAFVTKLNPQGTALVYSTYLGGAKTEYGYGVALDAARNAYVTGLTDSDNFPVLNALQPEKRGVKDAFVTKLNAEGTALVYSTYFGGATTFDSLSASGLDNAFDIAVDAGGSAYVVGETQTTDFPVTPNAFQQSFGGLGAFEGDAYVAKFSAGGDALVYSTYLGGSYGDSGSGIAVDSAGHAYVTGQTASLNFPVANGFQPALANTETIHDAFVTKLSPDGAAVVYSTYLGGNTGDSGTAVAVDAAGNAHITGSTNSGFFPLRNALQGTLSGKSSDAFVTKLDASGAALVYSTFLGGTQNDNGNAIALDGAGDAYVAGGTTSLGFPTTVGALSRTRNGQGDAFVSKIHVGADEPTYRISGRVTGADGSPLAGIEINLFGGARAHASTNAEGTYSFDGLRAGALYSLTAYTPCGTFATPNDTVNNLSSDQTIDFTGSVTTFTVSGYVKNSDSTRRGGVLITLSGGPEEATATTDANGEYTFTNVPGCRDYTVTPSAPGLFFTRPSRTYTYLSMNQPYNSFTAAPLSDNKPPVIYLYPQSTTHLAPSTVTLHADSSDTTGAVSKVDFYVGATLIGTDTHTVQEAQMGKVDYMVQWNAHTAGSYVVTAVATDSVGAKTTSAVRTFTISPPTAPKPLVSVSSPTMNAVYEMPAAVRVAANAQAPTGRTITKVEFYLADWMGTNLKPLQTDTTAPYGGFDLNDLAAGEYSVYAYAYDDAGNVGMTDPTYFSVKAPPARYSIKGRLVDANGAAVTDAAVALSGAAGEATTTDAEGCYSFENLAAGEEYVIQPYKEQYTFEPEHRTFTNLSAPQTGDFTATPVPAPAAVNHALKSNGGTVLASSSYGPNYPASSLNNGDRRGLNWNAGGGWNDASANLHPDWVEVYFNGQKSVSEVDVFTLQDAPAAPSEPTEAMQFTKYGVTAFEVRYWTGAAWEAVPGASVTGNDRVWRRFTFPAVQTSRIRVVVTGALAGYSRLTEVEAWGAASDAPAPQPAARVNAALAANGGAVTASSSYGQSYPASSLINGDRRGLNWNAGGGWNDATADSYPDWVEVSFGGGPRPIDEVGVFTLQDNPASPAEPTEAMTFTKYGATGLQVEYWTGSGWAEVPGGFLISTDRVWNRFTFPAVTTAKVRVLVNNALAGYSRLVEVEAWGPAGNAPAPELTIRPNVALAANGGTVTASSSYSTNYPVSSLNNGDRRGLSWNAGGGWNDASSGSYPDWVEVSFGGEKSLTEVGVFTLQDAPAAPQEPTEALTFSKYGVTAFEVQYWTGSAWAPVPGASVTGNDKVWRRFTFPALSTSKIRVVVTGALAGYSRLTEVEAY